MEILERVAYLKGLAEGLGIDTQSKEGKLISVMIEVLDDMALELDELRQAQGELEEGLDAVSNDLNDVEEYLYDEDDDEDDGEEDDDSEVYQTTCPNCNEEILFDETILADGYVKCPNCGEKLEFDFGTCPGCCAKSGAEDEEEDEDDEE